MKVRKANAMINNFWSYNYIYERLRITAENYGIKTQKKDEKYTSKTCSICGKQHKNGRKHRGLYICKTHKITLNADVNAVANIANPIFPKPQKDRDNWLMAQPLLHKIGVRNPKRKLSKEHLEQKGMPKKMSFLTKTYPFLKFSFLFLLKI